MKKETIFFSHSSKDKEAMNFLKTIIDEKTSGILNIFLSSDGESIPFGTNWIHSIEQGLNEAIIMYVFITPNSIKSDWIYFESGFAYSKGVKVIPIGFGTDICELKPPLNLLQGFNLTSYEGLNNIIKIINDECQTKFHENFEESDYVNLKNYTMFANDQRLWKYINCFTTGIYQYVTNFEENKTIRPNTEQAYKKVRSIIENENKYSENKSGILTNGLYVYKIVTNNGDVLKFKINPESLSIHFPKILETLQVAYENKEMHNIDVNLEDGYRLNENHIKISADISDDDRFGFADKKELSYPVYKFRDLEFFINVLNPNSKINKDVFLRIIFPQKDVSQQIIELVSALYDYRIIYKVPDEQ